MKGCSFGGYVGEDPHKDRRRRLKGRSYNLEVHARSCWDLFVLFCFSAESHMRKGASTWALGGLREEAGNQVEDSIGIGFGKVMLQLGQAWLQFKLQGTAILEWIDYDL